VYHCYHYVANNLVSNTGVQTHNVFLDSIQYTGTSMCKTSSNIYPLYDIIWHKSEAHACIS